MKHTTPNSAMDYDIGIEYGGFGPVSATASTNGEYVVLDFVSFVDHTKALRLCVPSERLEDCVSALRTVQNALADPVSGIHIQQPH